MAVQYLWAEICGYLYSACGHQRWPGVWKRELLCGFKLSSSFERARAREEADVNDVMLRRRTRTHAYARTYVHVRVPIT